MYYIYVWLRSTKPKGLAQTTTHKYIAVKVHAQWIQTISTCPWSSSTLGWSWCHIHKWSDRSGPWCTDFTTSTQHPMPTSLSHRGIYHHDQGDLILRTSLATHLATDWLPRVSAAIITPPLKRTPSTDVPVVIGCLQMTWAHSVLFKYKQTYNRANEKAWQANTTFWWWVKVVPNLSLHYGILKTEKRVRFGSDCGMGVSTPTQLYYEASRSLLKSESYFMHVSTITSLWIFQWWNRSTLNNKFKFVNSFNSNVSPWSASAEGRRKWMKIINPPPLPPFIEWTSQRGEHNMNEHQKLIEKQRGTQNESQGNAMWNQRWKCKTIQGQKPFQE